MRAWLKEVVATANEHRGRHGGGSGWGAWQIATSIGDVRTELRTEIHQLRVDFEARMASVEAKLDVLIARS